MLELDVLIRAIRLEQAIGGSLREDHYSPQDYGRDEVPFPDYGERTLGRSSYKINIELSKASDIKTRQIYLHPNISYPQPNLF